MEEGRDGTGTRAGWQLQEDYIFTGWSRRILEHHVKCKSAPIPLKQWALEELAKMEDRLREKGAVEDMQSMFDDIKEEGTHQTKLMGTDKDKKTATKAVCATRSLPTGCTTPCNPST
jgi:hypothetical protein